MPAVAFPTLGPSPLTATTDRLFAHSPAALYRAWTTGFGLWFAQPGTLSMTPQEGCAWFFYNRDELGRHPHYGRFLQLAPDKLIETTWLT